MNEFIILMASLMSIVALSIDAMLPALGIMGTDLGVSHPNQAQYVIGFIFAGMAIGQLVAGPISDAIGRKKILYGGLGIYMAGSVVCLFAPDLASMLVGRFIQGLGVSCPYVAAVAIVRDKYSGRDMARIMSLVMVIFILVPAVAPSLGQLIISVASWRAIFALYIGFALLLLGWLAWRLEETLHPEYRLPFRFSAIRHGFREVFQTRTTMCYTLCMGICFGSFIGYLNSAQQIFQVQFQAGATFTLYFGMLALVLGAASLVNSRVVQRFGMRAICLRSLGTIVLVSACFLAVNLTMPVTLWMFLGYAAALFFCFGLMFGNLNSLAMEPMGHIAGVASAVIGSVSSVISLLLGGVIGQLYDGTLIPMTVGFTVLGGISLMAMMYAETARPAEATPA